MSTKTKEYHFIYKTTNLVNGNYYYGLHSTNNLNDGYLGSGRRLRYSINKYGKINHTRQIIEFCKNRKELILKEKEIVNLNEIAKIKCMNISVGGAPTTFHSLSIRKRMSESHKGKILSDKIKKKMSESHKGKLIPNETKEKIRNSLLGKSLTEERKQKISKTKKETLQHKENHSMFGKYHNDTTKLKMSLSQKNIPKKKLKCPHCGKIGGEPQMKQWHFEKCKFLYKYD